MRLKLLLQNAYNYDSEYDSIQIFVDATFVSWLKITIQIVRIFKSNPSYNEFYQIEYVKIRKEFFNKFKMLL